VTPKGKHTGPVPRQHLELDDATSDSETDEVASQTSKVESVSTEPSLPDSVSESMLTMGLVPGQQEAQQTETRRLEQRQKQIDLGKDTIGYLRYTQMVPRYFNPNCEAC